MAQSKQGAIKASASKVGTSVEEYIELQQNGLKRCTKCKTWKEVCFFGKDLSRHDKLAASCVECRRVKERKNMKGRLSPFKGKNHTLEVRAEMSRTRQGKPGAKGRRLSEEQKQFISSQTRKFAVRQSEHPRWRGGITPSNRALRETAEARDWRKAVYERDQYTCQHCGENKGGNLQAHHIKSFADHPQLRCDTNNGITLCTECHRRVHYSK